MDFGAILLAIFVLCGAAAYFVIWWRTDDGVDFSQNERSLRQQQEAWAQDRDRPVPGALLQIQKKEGDALTFRADEYGRFENIELSARQTLD